MINYIPAYYLNKSNIHDLKENWWHGKCPFRHNSMLVSAYYFMKDPNFREHYKIPRENFNLVIDSGGFQKMSLGGECDKRRVLEWQEKNGDVALSYDTPLGPDDRTSSIRDKQSETAKNAYFMIDEAQKPSVKKYAVFHGRNLSELDNMFSLYKENGDLSKFDGYAIGSLVPVAGNVSLITRILTIFIEKLKEELDSGYKTAWHKPIHIFGLSSRNMIPIFAYLSRTYNIDISFDSNSFCNNDLRGDFIVNFEQNKSVFLDNRNSIKNKRKIKRIPCACPVCKNQLIDEYDVGDHRKMRYVLMHNLYQIINYTAIFRSLMDDKEAYFKYVKDMSEVCEALSFIDRVRTRGLEKVLTQDNYGNKTFGHKHVGLGEFM